VKKAFALAFSCLCLVGCGSNSVTSSSTPQPPIHFDPPTATLTATPARVNISHAATLDWKTTNATSADLSSVGSVAIQGATSITPTKTTTYTLTAAGPGGTQTASVTVTVLPNVDCWGDSLTAGNGGGGTNYPGDLALISNLNVYNGGVGATTSTQIAAHMLSSPSRFKDVIVIWSGRNNYTATSQVLTDIASMIAAIAPSSQFLILSVINGDNGSEYAGSPNYAAIAELNSDLQAAYPDNFLDIRKLLVTDGLSFEDVTPTSQDLLDITDDIPPASLRADTLHLNAKGYDFVANQVHLWLKAHSMEEIH
jgi:lysophospholipase L1-like esterase